jgi:gliding motility-associated-like protein
LLLIEKEKIMNLKHILGIWALMLSVIAVSAQPTMRITKLDANQGSIVDIDFTVDNYTRIVGFQFSVSWNPAVIQYESVKNINSAALEGFSLGNNFEFKPANPGLLNIAYNNPNLKDTTLNNNTRLFTVSFRVVGNVGTSTDIELIPLAPNDLEFIDHRFMNVGVLQDKGRVTVTGMGAPGVQFIAGTGEGSQNSRVCIPISANNFTNIGAFQYTLSWNPAFMRYDGLGNTSINIGAANVEANNTNGTLTVSWNSANGETRPNGTVLFEVCFIITDILGCSDVNFTGTPLSIEAATASGMTINVTTQPGRVCIGGVPTCIPNGFTVSIDRSTHANGDLFCVQYRVFNFTDIQSLQMTLQWNPAVIEYLSVRDFRLPNLNTGNFNDMMANQGRLAFVWFGDEPESRPDNSFLFEICFRAVGTPGSFTDITYTSAIVIKEATNGSGENVPIHECEGRVSIANVQPFTASITSSSNPTCETSNNGSITAQGNGGTPPYVTYAWTRNGSPVGGNTPTITNLGPGNYIVTVTDSGGATATAAVTLNPQFTISVTGNAVNPKCANSNDGSITLIISGNPGGTTYLWENGSTNRDRSNLGTGTYNVTITYAGGSNGACTITRSFTITAPMPLSISGGANSANRTIDITVQGGTSPYTYNWSPSGGNSPSLTDLEPGSYFVTVTDANGCTTTGGPYLILDTDDLVLDIETSDYNGFGVSCFGTCDGFIKITPLSGQAPFTYRWSVAGVTASELTNRCVGTYQVTVTDGSGKTATANVQLFTPERIRINTTAFQASSGANDGSATVDAIGGAGGYIYTWSDGTSGPSISGQGPVVVTVNVRDINNCTLNLPVNFGESGECFTHRLVITPNGDGLNDEFRITCLAGTTNRLEVFDRYGRMVYAASNYANDWQGTGSDGKVLADGVYFFVLTVTQQGSPDRLVRGSFNVLYDLK